ncbi:flagellar protein FliT [Erwinia persicina]|uniref:flagella biosynthesis regulatory protein FliT n=1 Tax=Erwinia TaxID=551 RepID=UPI000F6632A7|nr:MULTISPECIES: flagella biosynthesis regulatory protein FliT [Erwinia]MCP1440625.1 flagellar protein FliT [Erwinia persicina]MDN4626037.1 flagella biosynthesis regulatory protein FliT [Erwinia sp. PsM31]MDN8542312.1 flagella biosynthesis regulatory protein FliT [Erwinia sp. BC051422]RRZ94422.1 flagella biosynthesis regulatory protein FliT [Erwinia sp. 198]
MNIAPHLLSIYQQLLVLSQSMLRLATEGEWDKLIEMEVDYVSAVGKLAECTQQTPVSAQTQDQLRPVLRHILANEAEVKNLLQARKAELAQLISQTSRQKTVNKAYGGMAGVILFPQNAQGV